MPHLGRLGRRRLAVIGVRFGDLGDLAMLRGYVVGPALRSGIEFVIENERRLTDSSTPSSA